MSLEKKLRFPDKNSVIGKLRWAPIKKALWGLGVTALLAGVAYAYTAVKSNANFNKSNDVVAFVSNRDGNQEIYKMFSDGSRQTRITYNHVPDVNPSISPDGQYIAFASLRGNDWDIYIIQNNGKEERITLKGRQDNPHWFPSGNALFFESTDESGKKSLICYDFSNIENNKTITICNSLEDFCTSFSPDAVHYTAEFEQNGKKQVRFVKRDGNNSDFVYSGLDNIQFISWDPYGVKIALESNNRITITRYNQAPDWTDTIEGRHPCFSPDAESIIYTNLVDGSWKLFRYDLKKKESTQLTDGNWDDVQPDWR
ncbi:hypothetical protein KY338_01960 [Candidatus Woesearchaeota archaeon]|nr:hypothetical protein [Candidatus Woesearchaeota archaeon]MBW3005958.1 hypothetical protein [Candidatus Woesearchaeota archaeon]